LSVGAAVPVTTTSVSRNGSGASWKSCPWVPGASVRVRGRRVADVTDAYRHRLAVHAIGADRRRVHAAGIGADGEVQLLEGDDGTGQQFALCPRDLTADHGFLRRCRARPYAEQRAPCGLRPEV